MDFSQLPPQVISWVNTLAWILLASYGFSLLARFHWIFDLFSHFTIQYAIGGLFLGVALMLMKEYPIAIVCFALTTHCIVETRQYMHHPLLFQRPAAETNLVVMQYNRLFLNKRYERLQEWLEANGKDVDVLFVQESKPMAIERLKELKHIFQYQYPENAAQRFNDVSVLSRHPFELKSMPLRGDRFDNFATRVEIKKNDKPVVLYSFHTKVPMGGALQTQRNQELAELAKTIANDNSEIIIASGDWNITPYSPYFTDFLKTSGLRYQNYGLLPETTWFSHALLPFLKIPIDHVLYNGNLVLTDIARGPSMGSDHHSLIAKFAIPD